MFFEFFFLNQFYTHFMQHYFSSFIRHFTLQQHVLVLANQNKCIQRIQSHIHSRTLWLMSQIIEQYFQLVVAGRDKLHFAMGTMLSRLPPYSGPTNRACTRFFLKQIVSCVYHCKALMCIRVDYSRHLPIVWALNS